MPSVMRADSVSRALESVMTRYSGVLRTVGARYRLPSADLDELAQEVRVRDPAVATALVRGTVAHGARIR